MKVQTFRALREGRPFFDVPFTQQSDMTAKELYRAVQLIISYSQLDIRRNAGTERKKACIRVCCI